MFPCIDSEHSFEMAEVREDSKETLIFLVFENIRVEYLRSDVTQMVQMGHFKILGKDSRQNQLFKLSFERKVGQIV